MRHVAVALAMCVACKDPPETSGTSAVTSTTTAASSTVVPASTVMDVTWTMPSSWTTEPSVGMRKATYRISKQPGDKEDAIVSVIQAGGSIDENAARWKAQFNEPHDFARSQNKVGDLSVTTVEVHGTYTGGGVMVGESPEPRPGWGLVGAIVPTGSQPYFFKMLGPDKTVASARHDFQALVDSIRPK